MKEKCNSLSKRILFGNLVIKAYGENSGYVMMNLRSFRRQTISNEQYDLLRQFERALENHLEYDERALKFYNIMVNKKQILTEDQCRHYDTFRLSEYQKQVQNFKPLINLVTISPSFSCNFNCTYCYQRDFGNKANHMSKTDIDQICEYINMLNGTKHVSEGINAVSLNGGECCQPQNVEVINYILEIFSKNPSCVFSLYTNGSQIDALKDNIDFSKFYTAQVSLDGYDKLFPLINKVSEKTFDSVLLGIKHLAHTCNTVRIACMLTPTIIEHMDEFVYILKDKGILDFPNVSLVFSVISNFKKETIDRNFLSLDQYIQVRRRFAKSNYPNNVHISPLREATQISKHLLRDQKHSVEREHACNTIDSRSAMFAPNGKVYWCICSDREEREIGSYVHPTEQDKDRYMQYLYRSPNSMSKCRDCELKYVCRGGCPVFAAAQGKKPSEGYCGLFADASFWDNLEELL